MSFIRKLLKQLSRNPLQLGPKPEEMRLCVQCKWSREEKVTLRECVSITFGYTCTNPKLERIYMKQDGTLYVDSSGPTETPGPDFCETLRKNGKCGPRGKYWEGKND